MGRIRSDLIVVHFTGSIHQLTVGIDIIILCSLTIGLSIYRLACYDNDIEYRAWTKVGSTYSGATKGSCKSEP